MKMLFLYSISDTKSRNTDFKVVYDLAHRRRWFVTNFRLHFPFRLTDSNVRIFMLREESSWEAKVIYKDVGLLWMENCKCVLFSPYWYQDAMKQDVSIPMPPICLSWTPVFYMVCLKINCLFCSKSFLSGKPSCEHCFSRSLPLM